MIQGIRSYVKSVREGELTCEESVSEELSSIARYAKWTNAFTTIFTGTHGFAMSRAREIDMGVSEGMMLGSLAGLPITLKDNIFLGGFPTTDGSSFFSEFVPPVNADIADALLAAGCVPLGKTNLHELALGVTGSSAYGGPIVNPHDPSRISGGSSGGSAVSVALSRGPVASIGSDTGGSVRIPAALCGVYGFKPSQGILSTNGVFPLSATLDHLGLMTKTIDDMAYLFTALTGIRGSKPTRMRLGVPWRYFTDDMDEGVSRDFAHAVTRLGEEHGVSVRAVEPKEDFAKYARARVTIMCKEASWFYEELLHSTRARSAMHGDVLSLMDRGLRTGMIEYMHAMKMRSRSVAAVNRLLSGLDAIIMPTCLVVAPKIEDVMGNETGEVRSLLLRNTELFNTCGFPALSIPTGRGRSLPTSIQIVGRFGEDARVMAIGERVCLSLGG